MLGSHLEIWHKEHLHLALHMQKGGAQGRSDCAVILFFCTWSQPLACDAGTSMPAANTHPVSLCTQDWSGGEAHGVPSAAR